MWLQTLPTGYRRNNQKFMAARKLCTGNTVYGFASAFPTQGTVHRCFPFSPIALKHRERQRGCALRRGGLLLHYRARIGSWFLSLRGHPPRKQTLALGSSLAFAPSGWCALRDSGHQKEKFRVRQFSEASWVRRQRRSVNSRCCPWQRRRLGKTKTATATSGERNGTSSLLYGIRI